MFKRNVLFMLIILSFLIPTVSTQPFTVDVSDGFIIEPQFLEAHMQGRDYEFEVHVINKSNGYPIISGIGCYLHLYGVTGSHLVEAYDNSVSHNFDYSFDVDGENFTLGNYVAKFNCNSSTEGGSTEIEFPVTLNGKAEVITTAVSILHLGLLFLLTIFFILCIVGLRFSKQIYLTTAFMGFAYLILIAIFFVAWGITEGFIDSETFLNSFFEIGFYVLVITFFPFIIGLLIWNFYMMITIKNIKDMIDKGVPDDEAYARAVGRKAL